ncbi:MAG: PAS domain-containing protein, partial [Candidatus Contendobacter sp.]|nr:PAS domain-containing protein [Candidatus Contendobacter sp.]
MDIEAFGIGKIQNTGDSAKLLRKSAEADDVRHLELEGRNRELRHNMAELEQLNPFYLLFHQAPVGYLALDNIGLIHEVNETFCRMVDQERNQLIGRSFSECATDVERGVFLARYRALFRN